MRTFLTILGSAVLLFLAVCGVYYSRETMELRTEVKALKKKIEEDCVNKVTKVEGDINALSKGVATLEVPKPALTSVAAPKAETPSAEPRKHAVRPLEDLGELAMNDGMICLKQRIAWTKKWDKHNRALIASNTSASRDAHTIFAGTEKKPFFILLPSPIELDEIKKIDCDSTVATR